MMRQLKNSFLTLIVFCIPVVIFVLLTKFDDHQSYVHPTDQIATTTPEAVAHLSFVGDIMLDRNVKAKVMTLGAGDYHYLFQNADFLKVPDVMFANLEGPVSDRGKNVGSIYSFRFDPVVFSVLKDAGFLDMANNHIGDWGPLALADTLSYGKAAGFDMIGGGDTYEDAVQPKIFDVKGIKIGYLGFSDFGPPSVILSASSTHPGILSASDPYLSAIISDAAAKVDVLVVVFHFGIEYQSHSDDRQKALAHEAIDSGAKIVVGAHPHVPEEIEEYNGGIIAYSLGNFIFDQSFSTTTMQGMKFDVNVAKSGIKSYSTSTIQLNANYQPSLAN
jgi:poly-gamma-glutamate synthesis protein (capsule biosynthesis protein)